jgi:hypothetical protein
MKWLATHGRGARCSSRRHAVPLGKLKKTHAIEPQQSNGFSPPVPPPGTVGVAQPPRPGLPRRRPGLGAGAVPRVFLSHPNGRRRRSALCREWRRWCITTANWRLTLPWVPPEVGWWVTGATGHRKGQMRVLVSPSPALLHTSAGQRGGAWAGPYFFGAKPAARPLIHTRGNRNRPAPLQAQWYGPGYCR